MRNQYPAKCYLCQRSLGPREGTVVVLVYKTGKMFKVQCDNCIPLKGKT